MLWLNMRYAVPFPMVAASPTQRRHLHGGLVALPGCRSHTTLPFRSPTTYVPGVYNLTYCLDVLEVSGVWSHDPELSSWNSDYLRRYLAIRHGRNKSIPVVPACGPYQAFSAGKTESYIFEHRRKYTGCSDFEKFEPARIWHRIIRSANIWLG